MIRSMLQAYVKVSVKAVELYKKAFDAEIVSEYKDDDGNYIHVELNLFGQIFSLSESQEENILAGNTMQFCIHLGEEHKKYVEWAYTVLQEGAEVIVPLGPSSYSPMMVSFIDIFGACLFRVIDKYYNTEHWKISSKRPF